MTDETPDVIAAELALGLLAGEERAAALRRLLVEPAFAREVEAWRANFALLADAVPEVAAPEAVLARIEASLNPEISSSSDSRVRRWQGATAFLALLAAAAIAVPYFRPAPAPHVVTAPREPVLIAQLAPAGKAARLAALYDPASRRLRIARSGAPLAGPGRGEELWVIAGTAPPKPLGMIGHDGASFSLPPGDRTLLEPGAVLAVSIEPDGGSPTGAPTGPVVATGTIATI